MGVAKGPAPDVATSLADALEESILSGRLEPGTPLRQLDLASAYGVSRVPVRDALALLRQRDLALRGPRRGVIVRPVTAQTVRDVFHARRLVEGEVLRLAAPRLAATDLDALEDVLTRQRAAARRADLLAARATDQEFHTGIWRACGNAVLEGLSRSLWRRAAQARAVGHRAPGWVERSVARHERILAALRRRDGAAGAHWAEGAVYEAEEEILAQLTAVPTPAAPPQAGAGATVSHFTAGTTGEA